MGLPILAEWIQYPLEILLTLFLFFLLFKNYKYKVMFKQNPNKIRIYIITICFSCCILDLLISTIKGIFPMINFIIRSFLIIFLSQKLRVQWIKLIKIIYLTRNLLFILFLDILFFGIIGHILFKTDDFNTLFSSIDNMLVMLTTNNFPDVMLKTFPQSKFSIFYFIPYLLISYIVIIALLKALYYSNYLEINKEEILDFLNEISGFTLFSDKNPNKINLDRRMDNYEIKFTESNINRDIIDNNLKMPCGELDKINFNYKIEETVEPKIGLMNDDDQNMNNYFSSFNKIDEKNSESKNSLSHENIDFINIDCKYNYNYTSIKNQNNFDNKFDTHSTIIEEDSKSSQKSLLEDYDKISDKEREELYNYLKIIYSNFSLTKNEIKIIRKIIFFNSDLKETKNKYNAFDDKIKDKSFKETGYNNFDSIENAKLNTEKDNTLGISNKNNFSSHAKSGEKINENANAVEGIHNYFLTKVSAYTNDLDDLDKNTIKSAEDDLVKKNKEFNKFLLSENENENVFNENRFLNFTRGKYFEFILNILNISSILFLFFDIDSKNYLYTATAIHLSFSLYFIFEFIQFMRYYTFAKMLKVHLQRSLLFIVNSVGLILNLILFICIFLISTNIIEEDFLKTNFYLNLKKINESFVLLRALRIFNLLNKYKEFYTIFTTTHNLRGIFSSILWTLISFCFIFSTISIVLFGGKVDRYRYRDNTLIPENYHNLNFNDYSSGFMFCFAMIVINNMNAIFDDLSNIYGRYMKLYFSIFYFLGIILIVNITQMLILEMYLNIKETFSTLNGEKNFSRKNTKLKRFPSIFQ